MNIYHAWCDLKQGVSDIAFSEGVAKYLDHLRTQGLIESWRLTRRKLGFGHAELGDFHLMIEVKDMAQLDRAFDHVAERSEPTSPFISALIPSCRKYASPSTAIFLIRSASVGPNGFDELSRSTNSASTRPGASPPTSLGCRS